MSKTALRKSTNVVHLWCMNRVFFSISMLMNTSFLFMFVSKKSNFNLSHFCKADVSACAFIYSETKTTQRL